MIPYIFLYMLIHVTCAAASTCILIHVFKWGSGDIPFLPSFICGPMALLFIIIYMRVMNSLPEMKSYKEQNEDIRNMLEDVKYQLALEKRN